MVIEFLKFRVEPEERENYIRRDEEIWTAALTTYPGFLGKEVWINPQDGTQLILVIRWATKEQWQAIPPEELQAIEAKFTKALGKSYPIVESGEYQVRKFTY